LKLQEEVFLIFFLFAEAFGLVIVFLLIIKTVLSFIKKISKDKEDEYF